MPNDVFNPGNNTGGDGVYRPTGDHGTARGTTAVQNITAASPAAPGETVAQQAMAQIHATADLYARHLRDVAGIADQYPDQATLDAQVDQFKNTEAAKSIDAAVEAVNARVEQARAEVERQNADVSADFTDPTAELRAQRNWSRTREQLDKARVGALLHEITGALENGNPEQRRVLAQELPAYVESRGLPTKVVDVALSAVAPELASARERLAKAERAQGKVNYMAEAVRKGIDTRQPVRVKVALGQDDPDVN